MAFPPRAFMFQHHENNENSLNSFPSNCPPQLFHGSAAPFVTKRSVSFSGVDKSKEVLHVDDELSDDGWHLGEINKKKIRLNLEQVKALEKSFELGNKLEPERKLHLAKALGLQPRQIAIWFQNRRARWKTKQLERDYDALKKQFDALKSDNDALQAQNKQLSAELLALKSKDPNEMMGIKRLENNNNNEGRSWSNGSDNSTCDVNLDISTRPTSAMTQFLHTSSSRPDHHLQCLKLDQVVQEESFCHIFNGVADNDEDQQPGFWPWADHHQQQQSYH